jgi:signal transduction histidine kinase/integral membrane sensor domain MASE1
VVRRAAQVLLLAGGYVITGRLGLMVGATSTFATLVWPPTGISLAALLLYGSQLWPGVALGAFIVNSSIGAPPAVALGMALGNTLEALAGAYLVRRSGGSRGSIGALRPVLALIVLGALVSTLISASLGVSSLLLGGLISSGEFIETWRAWWLGDVVGALVVASLLLAWHDARPRARAHPSAEAALLAAAAIGGSLAVFSQPSVSGAAGFFQACLLLPLLMWGALRFGMRGATAAVFLAAVVAVWATALGRGPFVQETISRSLLLLQAFLAIAATGALVLGAVITEQGEALRRSELARRRSELLASLGMTLSAGRDLEEVMEEGACQLAELLGADDGALCLAEPDGRCVRGVCEIQPGSRVGALLDLDDLPHSRLAAEQRRSVYFTKAEAAGAEGEWFEKLGLDAVLVVPLVSEDRLVGILYLDYWEDRFSRSREDLDFVTTAAELCALALARAQAYEAERSSRLQAEAAEQEAKRMAELQERLVAIVSHDLLNPLNTIAGGIDLFKKRRNGHPEHWEETVLDRQSHSVQRMEEIIRTVLDALKARHAGGIPVSPAPMELGAICRHVIAELEQAHPRSRIVLSVEREDRGEWDAARMAQVMSNLVANAIRHSPEGDPVEVRIRGSVHHAVVDVHNFGPPIPPEVLSDLFEPFIRGPENSGRPEMHVGLGLFIVREIARAHGGTVDVCSRADRGTSFVVKMPRSQRRQGQETPTARLRATLPGRPRG